MYNKCRRIKEDMSMKSAVHALSSGNLEIATMLSKLLDSEPLQRARNILALDELGIYGRQLNRFLTVCCNGDFELVNATLLAYRDGYISEDEVWSAIKKDKQILHKPN